MSPCIIIVSERRAVLSAKETVPFYSLSGWSQGRAFPGARLQEVFVSFLHMGVNYTFPRKRGNCLNKELNILGGGGG